MICLEEKDFPCSCQTADRASVRAQRKYLIAFRFVLGAMIIGATLSWSANIFPAAKLGISLCAAISLLLSFALTVSIKYLKYEDSWYVGRAIAESLKTRSWSFSMAVGSYGLEEDREVVRSCFIADVRKIVGEKGDISLSSDLDPSVPEISTRMWELRAASLHDRLETYLNCRVADQRRWYAGKSKASVESEEHSFVAMYACQIASIVVSMVSMYRNLPTSGLVGLFTSLAAAVLAWLQVRKYQETGKSYEIASQELGFAMELAALVHSEEDFASFVRDTETAISREHTLWIARRGNR